MRTATATRKRSSKKTAVDSNAASTPPPPTPDPRQQLRDLSRLVREQDPIAMAGLVTEIESTLASCVRIQHWFRFYIDALKKRRVQ